MTNTDEIVTILDSILGAHKVQKSAEFLWFCPFCNHPKKKLAVNVQTGKWHCWTCSAKGSKLLSLFRKLNVSREQIRRLASLLEHEVKFIHSDITESILMLPTDFKPLWEINNDIEQKHALKYLSDRNVTKEEILKHGIGYCTEGNYKYRIIMPSYDSDGILNYFISRSYGSANPKYWNPPVSKNIIVFDNMINWNYDKLILCEGVFDSMAIKRNSIPLLGKTIPKKLQYKIIKSDVNKIYLALDNDALKSTLDIAKLFMNEGKSVYIVELTGKDPSEIGFSKMNKLIKNSTPLTFSDLIKLKLSLV